MNFKEFLAEQALLEAPLPDDWDKGTFKGGTFKNILAYAKERANKIGAGSSRVAFEIDYKGKPSILKIAKNGKGLAQNEAEVDLLSDGYFKHSEVLIPMIDHDEDNGDRPKWVHLQKADKIRESDIVKACGGTLIDLIAYAYKKTENKNYSVGDPSKIDEESDFVNEFIDLIHQSNISLGDLTRLANWGMYKGHPVIIDLGLTPEVFDLHYRRR